MGKMPIPPTFYLFTLLVFYFFRLHRWCKVTRNNPYPHYFI